MIMSRNGTGNLFSGIRIRARVGRGLAPAIGKAALRMTGQIPALPEICGSNKHRKESDKNHPDKNGCNANKPRVPSGQFITLNNVN